MAARDLLTDCSAFFRYHLCPILWGSVVILLSVALWYASRIDGHFAKSEAEVEAIKSSVQAIEINVAVIRERLPPRPERLAMQAPE